MLIAIETGWSSQYHVDKLFPNIQNERTSKFFSSKKLFVVCLKFQLVIKITRGRSG